MLLQRGTGKRARTTNAAHVVKNEVQCVCAPRPEQWMMAREEHTCNVMQHKLNVLISLWGAHVSAFQITDL